MFKRVLLAVAVAAAVSAPAFAEVSINGSAEMDLFYRTNNGDGTKTGSTGKLLQEIAIVINIDGKDKLDSGNTLSWRLAQKVATPDRFDAMGIREAWIAYGGDWGTLKFGNQWSNTYLIQDWPYGSKGFSGTVGEVPNTGFGSGISYTSPTFGGFNVSGAYDFGNGNSNAAKSYEVTVQGAVGPVNLDAGYFKVDDGGPVPNGRDWSGGATAGRPNGMTNTKGASYDNWIVGARGSFADVAIRGAVRGIDSETSTGVKSEQIGYLLDGTYSFGKNALSLGYFAQTAKTDMQKQDDNNFDTIGFQWDYSLSKNTGAFLQIRHNMVGKDWAANSAAWQNADGKADNKDNATRILVGTWSGF